MYFKIFFSIVVVISIRINVIGQDDLTLREALRNKIWYVIKIIPEVSLTHTVEFSCSEDKPYLFYLTANSTTLKRDYSYLLDFPRELTFESDKIYYVRAKWDSTYEKVYFKVNNFNEDFLDISDEKNIRYLIISDDKHSF